MTVQVEKVQHLLDEMNLQALIIKSKANKTYLESLTGSGVWLLITKQTRYAFMDGRYVAEAQQKMNDFQIEIVFQGTYLQAIIEKLTALQIDNIGFEDRAFSIQEYQLLQADEHHFEPLGSHLAVIRAIKTDAELAKMKAACQLTDTAFAQLLVHIKAGVSEKWLLGQLYAIIFGLGADGMAFDPIIASGIRGAMPHGRATDKLIQEGELVTIDFGIILAGYQSDMTRTVAIGQPSVAMKRVYETVKAAQQLGIDSLQVGTLAADNHNIVADFITDRGYGDYFNHGLGHGMGIGDGELPVLNAKSPDQLQVSMVMSCEPGIYIPDLGGVRIEDDVVVTKDGPVVLNETTKTLLVL